MRILRVVPLRSKTGTYGGPADTAAAQTRLTAQGDEFEVTLLSGHLSGDQVEVDARNYRDIQIAVRPILRRFGFSTLFSRAMAGALSREVGRADVVHLSFSRELIPVCAALLAVARRTPFIAQPHGMLTARTSPAHRLSDLVVKPVYRRAAEVLALSTQEADELSSWCSPGPHIRILGNPTIATAKATPTTPDPDHDAIFLGRIEKRKRPLDFIAAARHASSVGWTDRYLMVGPMQSDPDAITAASEGLDNFDCEAAVSPDEVPSVLSRSRVFVLPAWREPWGNVLVMALARHMPVVVTASAALANDVREFSAGEVVPDGDPQAIAEAVHRLVQSPTAFEAATRGAAALYEARLSDAAVECSLRDMYRTLGAVTPPGRAQAG